MLNMLNIAYRITKENQIKRGIQETQSLKNEIANTIKIKIKIKVKIKMGESNQHPKLY